MKTKMLFTALLLGLFVPARAPAVSSAFCDGIAPQTVSCEADFHLTTDTPQPAPAADGYVGTVTATITTETGSVSMSCTISPRDLLTSLNPVATCGVPHFEGVMVMGQAATLTGTIKGSIVPGSPGLGPWHASANG